jgi:hypothetical protein
MAVARVVDDEIQIRPVLRRPPDVADIGVRQQVGELLRDRRSEQSLMDTDVADTGLAEPLVRGIHQLFVVHPPRIVAGLLVGVIADSIALPAVRTQHCDGVVDAVQPAGLARRDGIMRQQPP